MTEKTPASDEEIVEWQENMAAFGPLSLTSKERFDRLVSRVEAEVAKREEAEGKIENAVMAMAETQPSWGWRISRVFGALGSDFGGPDAIDAAIETDVARKLGDDKEDFEYQIAAQEKQIATLQKAAAAVVSALKGRVHSREALQAIALCEEAISQQENEPPTYP